MQPEVLKPHVNAVVSKVLDVEKLTEDDDGRILVDLEHAKAHIRVTQGPAEMPRVLFRATLRTGLDASDELLRRVNTANASSPYLKFVLMDGTLSAVMDVLAESLQPADVENAFGLLDLAAERTAELFGLPEAPLPTENTPEEAKTDVVRRDLAEMTGPAAHVEVPAAVLPNDPSPADGAMRVRLLNPGYL